MRQTLLNLFVFFASITFSQTPYGHEWIDVSKPHYKFGIISEGIYRISYSSISANCPEIALASASEICIYNNGKQIPIYISWASSPTATDFIEFYANKLDGEIDKKLYVDSTDLLNPYTSLFKDTNYFFLTIRSGSNARLLSHNNDTLGITDPYLNYCIAESTIHFKQAYNEGRRWYYSSTGFVFLPSYDIGEGWGTNSYASQSIATPNAVNIPGVDAKIKTRVFGRNEQSHKLEFKLNGNTIGTKEEVGSTNLNFETTFATSFINLANSTLIINPLLTNNHGYCLGFATISYPRDLSFSGLNFYTFSLPASTGSSRFELSNYNSSNEVVLYDLSNRTRTVHNASTSHRFIVDVQSANSKMAITHSGSLSVVNSFSKINWPPLLSQQGNFVIIAHRAIQYDSSGLDIINEYKLYKESAAGGSFKVVVAYMDELQELFGYGMPKHPIAIRKFLQWAFNTWSINPPQYAFLVGKGYNVNALWGANPTNYYNNFIPSFGTSPSDYHYTTMDGSNSQFIPIGRLAATNGNIVKNYLNKLKEYNAEYFSISDIDQNPNKKEYMKWLIHLGGGTGVDQQADYRANLKSYESLIKDISYGAKVFSVFKNGPDISEDVTSVDLTNRINKGVSLITFFGHSSATIFDVGIGEPNSFTNKGKYPIFLANGCNSGYFYGGAPSYSEGFINLPDKGAIGFLATTNVALDVTLYQYGEAFYHQLSNSSYNISIGNLIKNTSETLMNGAMNYLKTTPTEFNLNGDPSVMMNQYPKPDYYIDPNSVIFPTTNLNTTQDSFSIKLIVQNLAKAIKSDIKIKIERINNGNSVIYDMIVKAPYFKDTFTLSMPIVDGSFGVGINNFNIKIESEDKIAEMSEANNEIRNVGNLLIENDDILPIFPYEFSIVSTNTAKLTAMSTLIDKKAQNYHFQIDTTESFNSPLLKTYSALNTAEGIISWLPQLVFQDSIVYYWRVSKDSVTGKGFRWNNSSFIYISNQPLGGWNQSHFYQFGKNIYKNITLNPHPSFKFVNDVKSISIRTNGSNNVYETEWYLNNARQAVLREAGRMTNGIFAIWIDGKSGIAKQSLDSNYGSAVWGNNGSIAFGYTGIPREGFVFQDTGKTPATHPQPNTPWSKIILDFVNQVPTGDYLIFYSNKKPIYSAWDSDLKNYFLGAGFSGLQQLIDTAVKAPFIFGYRKNDPSFPVYYRVGANYSSYTSGELFISGAWKEGYKESVVIGPTLKWHTLSYELNSLENPNFDENRVELYGIKANKQKDLLASFISNKLDTTLSWIDPNVYIHLQLKLISKDEKDRTPVQLRYWRVYYEDIGEVAVVNNITQVPPMRDTIENGDIFTLNLGSETLNSKTFDSVSYKINITQAAQTKSLTGKFSSLAGNSFSLNQRNILLGEYFEGENNVFYEINPKDFGYQKEKYDINNYGRAKFFVKTDKENPLLDVTFDGVHIVNNELVSANPNIRIVLKDENKYLLLNDTSLINLYLKYPSGVIVPVYFNQTNVNYTLASVANSNKAEINYKPSLTDGTYQLIVKDVDKSGNSSSRNGNFDYKISFQVITKNQISQFFNYPNPFSTATQFVFTITGSKIPDFIKIQIINIRGQVVKEIFKEQLGAIKLGVNRTQYAWDGKDQYGDMLANGVYLYKVIVKDGGHDYPMMEESDFKSITKSTQNLSPYFTNGWGKMVIIR